MLQTLVAVIRDIDTATAHGLGLFLEALGAPPTLTDDNLEAELYTLRESLRDTRWWALLRPDVRHLLFTVLAARGRGLQAHAIMRSDERLRGFFKALTANARRHRVDVIGPLMKSYRPRDSWEAEATLWWERLLHEVRRDEQRRARKARGDEPRAPEVVVRRGRRSAAAAPVIDDAILVAEPPDEPAEPPDEPAEPPDETAEPPDEPAEPPDEPAEPPAEEPAPLVPAPGPVAPARLLPPADREAQLVALVTAAAAAAEVEPPATLRYEGHLAWDLVAFGPLIGTTAPQRVLIREGVQEGLDYVQLTGDAALEFVSAFPELGRRQRLDLVLEPGLLMLLLQARGGAGPALRRVASLALTGTAIPGR